jgi:hypothetical protein
MESVVTPHMLYCRACGKQMNQIGHGMSGLWCGSISARQQRLG